MNKVRKTKGDCISNDLQKPYLMPSKYRGRDQKSRTPKELKSTLPAQQII